MVEVPMFFILPVLTPAGEAIVTLVQPRSLLARRRLAELVRLFAVGLLLQPEQLAVLGVSFCLFHQMQKPGRLGRHHQSHPRFSWRFCLAGEANHAAVLHGSEPRVLLYAQTLVCVVRPEKCFATPNRAYSSSGSSTLWLTRPYSLFGSIDVRMATSRWINARRSELFHHISRGNFAWPARPPARLLYVSVRDSEIFDFSSCPTDLRSGYHMWLRGSCVRFTGNDDMAAERLLLPDEAITTARCTAQHAEEHSKFASKTIP
ncbi:hypothetical protein BDZ89DRAFT_1150537 [Hymenopellis radicata]|nr:hypothetical protein BDZ89DRAFT_1150537 [Hymenopellis radicata]